MEYEFQVQAEPEPALTIGFIEREGFKIQNVERVSTSWTPNWKMILHSTYGDSRNK